MPKDIEKLSVDLVLNASKGVENSDYSPGKYEAVLYGPKGLVREAEDEEFGTPISVGIASTINEAIDLLASYLEVSFDEVDADIEEIVLINSGETLNERGFAFDDYQKWVPDEGDDWLVSILDQIKQRKFKLLIYWWRYLSIVDYVDSITPHYVRGIEDSLKQTECILGIEAAPPGQEYAAYIVKHISIDS